MTRLRPALLALPLTGVAVALALRPFPPLHLLTHELSQLFGAVAGLAWLGVAWRMGRRGGEAEGVWAAIGGALLLGAGLLGAHLVLDGPVSGCHTGGAAAFFLLTWVPIACLGSVVGVATGRRGWPLWAVLLGAVLLFTLGVGVDVAQGLRGLRVVDPLLGPALCIDQRAPMDLDVLLLLQRGWLMLVAASLWGLHRWPVGRLPTGILAAATLLLSVGGGSHLGLGLGLGAIHAELDQEARSEHFVARYGGTGEAALYVDLVLREAEWQLQLLGQDWAFVGEPITLHLYEDDAQVGRLSGFAYPHAWPEGVALAWPDAFEGTLRHELVHVLQGRHFPEPWLLVDRAATEGVAEAWEDELPWLPEAHAMQAAALEQGTLPSAAVFTRLFGFSTLNEGAAYNASASFFGFLVLTEGWAPFARYQQTGSVERAWGAPVEELDERWRSFLREQVSVDRRARIRARRVFDPRTRPSYRERSCPKLGSDEVDLTRRARDRWEVWDHPGAARDWQVLWERTGVPTYAAAAATAWLAADADEAAATLLDAALAHPGDLAEDEHQALLEVQLVRLLRGGTPEASAAVLGALPEEDTAALRRLLFAEVDSTEVEPPPAAVAQALATARPAERRARLRALLEAHPDSADLRLLVLERGIEWPRQIEGRGLGPAGLAELELAVSLVTRTPGACDAVAPALIGSLRRLLQLAHEPAEDGLIEVVGRSCEGSLARFHGERLEARSAFNAAWSTRP